MTDNLPAVLSDEERKELAALTGQDSSGPSQYGPPRLDINRDFIENEAGDIVLKGGIFKITIEDKTYFGSKVTFRPYTQRFQDQVFDENANDGKGGVVNQTILAKDFYGELIDEKGGTRCGKLSGKQRKEYSKEQLKAMGQSDIQTYRHVFGTVHIEDAKDGGGNPVEFPKGSTNGQELTGVPCTLRLRGTNFMPFGEQVEDVLNKNKILFPEVALKPTTTKHKNGDTTYYVIDWNYDPTVRLPIGPADIALLREFDGYVADFNKKVREKYDAALRGGAERDKDQAAADALGEDFGSSEDLGDDIPL